ncbi:MAG: carboxypeptidase-like regulatory domain-containing protein [Acidobacteriaceae bacterium]|nr:carboxypeptidase-like regulatory domain-containing protein [Acidobacteriaceae bacterium]
MKTLFPSLRTRACRTALLIVPFVLAAVAVKPVSIAAQRGPVQRVVQGKVVDKADAVLKGAIVYLKDSRSLTIKSFITTDQGEYRFGQLAQNTDYELWAEKDGKKSATRTISSYDSRSQFNINLKIEK